MDDLTQEDRAALARRGMNLDVARRQLDLLRHPPGRTRLDRPCRVGDGIVALPAGALPGLEARHAAAAAAGRLSRFVPASGAASRMFQGLVASRGGSGDAPAELSVFMDGLRRFAFWEALQAELARRGAAAGDRQAVLAALLDPDGLGYAELPKGLLPFHRYGTEARTALEEHLIESSAEVQDAAGVCRLHFTVGSHERERFEARLDRIAPGLEARLGARFRVGFSVQSPETDTLALTAAGRPFRDGAGRLVFRPGGHGALLANLARLDADVVLIKNIDNVGHDPLSRPGARWRRVLCGLLLELRTARAAHRRALGAPPSSRASIEAAQRFATERLGEPAAAGCEPEALLQLFARPLRVCGVVKNAGEPGGGPFWVEGRDGAVRRQIVESAEVDPADAGQRAVLAAATHFNPVDMVCALRDEDGGRFELQDFADPEAVIVARKSWEGRDLLALEHPGLWNGGMARWTTVFVEIPGEAFTPVKTVTDLLRPEHGA